MHKITTQFTIPGTKQRNAMQNKQTGPKNICVLLYFLQQFFSYVHIASYHVNN